MNNKLLAEYCGITWHTVTNYLHPVLMAQVKRCACGRDIDTEHQREI